MKMGENWYVNAPWAQLLCSTEIPEDKLVKSFESSVDALSELWRERYARKRIKSLIDQTRTNMETLYYDDLIHLSWEETKQKYLNQVGR